MGLQQELDLYVYLAASDEAEPRPVGQPPSPYSMATVVGATPEALPRDSSSHLMERSWRIARDRPCTWGPARLRSVDRRYAA